MFVGRGHREEGEQDGRIPVAGEQAKREQGEQGGLGRLTCDRGGLRVRCGRVASAGRPLARACKRQASAPWGAPLAVTGTGPLYFPVCTTTVLRFVYDVRALLPARPEGLEQRRGEHGRARGQQQARTPDGHRVIALSVRSVAVVAAAPAAVVRPASRPGAPPHPHPMAPQTAAAAGTAATVAAPKACRRRRRHRRHLQLGPMA